MTTFILIPGAGGSPWYWSRVAALLKRAGHTAVAVDLPGDDEASGLPEYARLVIAAAASNPGQGELVLVAQSLGGFTAAMASAELQPKSLVFVNAMIPVPGETPGEWWGHTAAIEARDEAAKAGGYGAFDLETYFLHDLPPGVLAEGEAHQRPEADAVFGSVCDFPGWPAVPVRVLAGADDRFFPVDFQRRIARERLDVAADVLPGGHLLALAQPDLVADYLRAG